MAEYAIYVRNAHKAYGSKQILNNFNMRVQKGTIYGLLGASGCGKTTLLSCVVGRKKLDSGELWVLGGIPGTENSGVPGSRVGYMPQDINLVGEFTVKGAIYYFGRILDMEDDLIEERFNILRKLLDLPPNDRMIKNCSGGQQRRVSFAAAMVHKPELLILDEPTVGLDPVLRHSIWNYLVDIAQKENTAIVITTHYIEEATQANQVGLMREGRLLAEDAPDKLLTRFGTNTLEQVFLILCRRQEEQHLEEIQYTSQNGTLHSAESEVSMAMSEMGHGSCDILTKKSSPKRNKAVGTFYVNRNHLKALMGKNWLQYFRNTASITFNLVLPIIEMLAFLSAVGGDVKDIGLGVVNDEHTRNYCGTYNRFNSAIPFGFSGCNFTDLSCRFLEDLKDPMIDKVYYEDFDDALNDVTHGKIVGFMYFSRNFSSSYEERLSQGRSVDNFSLDASEIKVWMDMSNRQIGLTIKFKLLKKFQEFSKNLAHDCKQLERLVDIPIEFNYEYGSDTEMYTVYMTPGVLLTVIFFMSTIMASTIIITDRLEGVWDRSIVAGVSSFEILITHFATQIFIIFLQVIEVLILTFVVYKSEHVGSFVLICAFAILVGFCGMCFGFFVSIVSHNHNMANIVTTGTFMPMIVLCGIMWPLEAQPLILRFISKCLPFTVAILSLRNVMKKGWNVDNLQVLDGIGVTLLWIIAFCVVNLYLIKRKR